MSKTGMKRILFASHGIEWYTPSIYVEAAREVMGSIDLDPASCELANQTVRAMQYYSQKDNGLLHPWHGNIWLNPPYGTTNNRSNTRLWMHKLLAEYTQSNISQAIILVNADTDTRWFHQLFDYPICFTAGRVNFYSPIHKTDTAFSRPGKERGNTHGSAFAYLGANEQKFIDVFSQFGRITKAVDIPRMKTTNLELWSA